MKTRKSWREKLADDKGLPKVGPVEGKMTTRWGTATGWGASHGVPDADVSASVVDGVITNGARVLGLGWPVNISWRGFGAEPAQAFWEQVSQRV